MMGAQAFGLCNNHIADITAWVQAQDIRIPVLSDFAHRSVTGYLAGTNPDGTARRVTMLVSPEQQVVWEHRYCENATHHVDEALAELRRRIGGEPAPVPQLAERITTEESEAMRRARDRLEQRGM